MTCSSRSFFWSSASVHKTEILKIHDQRSPRGWITPLGQRVLLFVLGSPSVYMFPSTSFPSLSPTAKTLFSKQWKSEIFWHARYSCVIDITALSGVCVSFLQFHNSDCLSTWLLHFIATNYLIFSQKPEFQDLSGNLSITFKTIDVFTFCLDRKRGTGQYYFCMRRWLGFL